MQNSNWVTWAIYAYLAIFVFGVLGFAIWRTKRRMERPPLMFKLLRAPGETLRRRLAGFDESGFLKILGLGLLPLVAFVAVAKFLVSIAPQSPLGLGLGIVAGVALTVLYFAGRLAYALLHRYRNDALGYLGERAVGEALEPLVSEGFRVFHDVPAEGRTGKFNVDHVVVGPNGIFAIETKTRRKGRARPGFEEHKVAYDGARLIWPWAEDTHGLENAKDRAAWLGTWLQQRTGLAVKPQPVLALPGWYVVPKGLGPVLVLNHKQLATAIPRQSAGNLTPQQIDLIARQLDDICRDVED